ncbi:MAG: hypothetical protein CML23_00130 [Rhizobiaceae bacterium]|nr:hypothetical protein [Rhizobiaceae bacterium]|tara:strand:+ start:183 stop:452 length:270 start_codon:yes stop_codon:yes gene_type:complete
MENAKTKPPMWRIILAYFLDFQMLFWVLDFLIGYQTGQLTPNGFDVQGVSALLLTVLMVSYFVICHMYLRGTLWRHILRVARPKAGADA